MANRRQRKSPSNKKSKRGSPSWAKTKSPKFPKGAVVLIVAMHARPGQESLLQAELTALVRPSRKEEGCLAYDLHRSDELPGDFLFYEVWSSRDAHSAHRDTPHFRRWSARKDNLLASRESTFWKQIA